MGGISHYRRELESALISRAQRDDEFRQILIADPRNALEMEIARLRLDVKLPPSLKVKVVEEKADTIYVVLPPDLASIEKPPDDFFLEAVRGLDLKGNQ